MAGVEVVVGWQSGVTEPPYQLLTVSFDHPTLTTTSSCVNQSNVNNSSEYFCQENDTSTGCQCSSVTDDTEESRHPPNWPVFLLFVIVIIAIAGNVLVCLAVAYKRKLQNMFNYFLVSLALSDMLSAILIMPLSIIKTALGT